MNRTTIRTTLALSASLAALPALAATPPNQPDTASPNHMEKALVQQNGKPSANNGAWTTATTEKPPSALNPLLTDKGLVRIKKLIGSKIYNDQDKLLGYVENVLMGKTGEPVVVVRLDSTLHAVPWSTLRFGDANANSDNKVLMPGMSVHALNGTPVFHYTSGKG